MSTDENASTSESSSGFLSRLPSWRSWISLLVGIAVGIGAFALTSAETRVGVRATQVTIEDPTGYFDEEELREAVDEVTWGRSLRVLIAVIPVRDLEPTRDCLQDRVSCLQTVYPSYFPSVDVADDAIVFWLDPEREIASVGMGVPWQYQPNSFYQIEYDLSRIFTYRAASQALTPETITDGFQIISDREANVASGRSWTDYILAIVAGGVAALLVGLVLNAAHQSAIQRRRAAGLAKLPASKRRDIVDNIFDTYRDAGATLDEIELIRATRAGKYRDTLDLRVSQYQRRYVQLARFIFEVQHIDRNDLIKPAHLPQVAVLDRLATIVKQAELTLRADEHVFASDRNNGPVLPDDHPSLTHLRTALDAAKDLAAKTGHAALVDELPAMAQALDKVNAKTPGAALADLDNLARRFSTIADPAFVTYVSEHGAEYSRRAEIEDPFRYRTLELTRTDDNGTTKSKPSRVRSFLRRRRSKSVTAARVKQNLQERLAAAKVEQDSRSLRVPVSPIIIMVAAALAIGAGGIYLLLNPVGEGEITDAEGAAVTIPETIAETETERSGALAIPDGADFDSLYVPSNVEIIDDAGLFEDTEALEEALAVIPMPAELTYVVLTTDTRLDEKYEGMVDDLSLLTEFPEHYEQVGDIYAGLIADDTLLLWFADSGEQAGFDESFSVNFREHETYPRLRALDAARNSYATPELQAWDMLAGYSTAARGIGNVQSDSTLTTGSSNVTGAVVTAIVAFVALVFLLPLAIKPLVVRRRRKAWQKELDSTLTALTLAHDALKLDITMVAHERPDYDSQARFVRWDKDYLEVLHLTTESTLPLETQLRLARTVREQAESLWRIRPILELQPTWSQAWENESSALYAALDSSKTIDEIAELAPKLSDGSITPTDALKQLDEIAQGQPETSRLRCLERVEKQSAGASEPEDEVADSDRKQEPGTQSLPTSPLLVDSRKLADSPLFSLAPKDEIDIGVAGSSSITADSVQEIPREQETARAFFSINTSVTRWLQSVGTTVGGYFRGLHEQSASQITKTLLIYSLVAFGIFIIVGTVNAIIGDGRDLEWVEVERSDPPLSVTYVDAGGEELSDEFIDRLSTEELGAPVHLVLYTTSLQCKYDTIDNQQVLLEEAPLAVGDLYDRIRPKGGSVVLCLGDESVYEATGEFVELSDEFDDRLYDYRYRNTETLSHEEWISQWLDDPDRGQAFHHDIPIVKQLDEAIR